MPGRGLSLAFGASVCIHAGIILFLVLEEARRPSTEMNISARSGQGLLRVRSGSISGDAKETPGRGAPGGGGETGTPGVITSSVSELLRSIEYPSLARQMEIQGRVVVRTHIDADGSVRSARIAQSSGYDVLDRAALRGIHEWRFPKTPAGADLEIPVRFTLDDR